MATPTDNHGQILTHAVLVGLTPLIPIPILDDLVKAYFLRRLARRLAAAHGTVLADADVAALSDEPESGCLLGCVGTLLVYPIKKIFRKIFFILEIKRAVDLTSNAYHRGLLIDHALARGAFGASPRPAAEVRSAIDEVLRHTATKPVEHAVRLTYGHSTNALRRAASRLAEAVRGVPRSGDEARVREAVEAVQEEEDRELGGLTDELRGRLESLPRDYFERLFADLRARLHL